MLLQGYPDLEYIIIDGGSSDDSVEIMKKYEQWLTHWVSEPDRGQSDAINKGWRMAKGEVCAWLNSDDTYMPSALETAARHLKANPDCGMVYGDCNIVDEEGGAAGRVRTAEFDPGRLLCGFNMIPQPSAFIRSSVLDEVGYLDVSLFMAMDLDLWIRIGLQFEARYVPVVLASFRRCEGTKSVSSTARFFPEIIAVMDSTFRRPGLPQGLRATKRDAYKDVHILAFRTLLAGGHRRQALAHLGKAIMRYPGHIIDVLRILCSVGVLTELFPSRRALERASKMKKRLARAFHLCRGAG